MHTLAAHPHIARRADHGSSAILKRSRIEPDRDMTAFRHLQQSLGNQAMQRLFEGMVASALGAPEADAGSSEDPGPAPVQAKLTINVPGDQYEQEADRVADQVMGTRSPGCCGAPTSAKTALSRHSAPGTVMRQAAATNGEGEMDLDKENAMVKLVCPDCGDLLQPKKASSGGIRMSRESESDIHGVKGDGMPLSNSLRAFFEPRLGHDFSNVKVHTSARAGETAERMNALAYTMGPHIVFAPGQFAPDSDEGKRLLAHELTHVVQQSASSRLPDTASTLAAGQKENLPENQLPVPSLASPVDIHMKADPDQIFRHTKAYCDQKYEDCCDICRSLPNRTKAQKARRALCWAQCMSEYAACLASSDEALMGALTGAAIAAAIVLASADGPFPVGDAAAVGLLSLVGINVF